MNFHFESFATSLIDMWGFDDGESASLGWKRHWAGDTSTGTDSGVYDLLCALVDDTVVISLEANADFKTFILGSLGGFSSFCLSHDFLFLSTISDCD